MEDELEQRAADYLSSVLDFNGERIDPVLGGYHLGNGYRLYSPTLRRFTSPDTAEPALHHFNVEATHTTSQIISPLISRQDRRSATAYVLSRNELLCHNQLTN